MQLLQEEVSEEQDPNQVKPANHETAKRYNEANDETDKAAALKECRPSDNQLRNPVYTGNKQEKKLHQTALSVKPSHGGKTSFFKTVLSL